MLNILKALLQVFPNYKSVMKREGFFTIEPLGQYHKVFVVVVLIHKFCKIWQEGIFYHSPMLESIFKN